MPANAIKPPATAVKSAGMLQRLAALRPSLSASATIALITFFGMVVLTTLAWLLAWSNPTWVPWGVYLSSQRAATLLVLGVCACLAEYLLFRTWFDESPIRDADLRQQWTSGQRFLDAEQVDVESQPCFVVLDAANRSDDWFAAAGLRVAASPVKPDAAIRFYADGESMFLVLRDVGSLGLLLPRLETLRRNPPPVRLPMTASTVAAPQTVSVGTTSADAATFDPAEPSSEFAAIDVDHVWNALSDETSDSPLRDQASTTTPIDESTIEAAPEETDLVLRSTDVVTQSRRLASIGRRLASLRRPVVPANGVCVLLPSGVLTDIAGSGSRLGQAVHHDLQTLRTALGASIPVSIAFVGAEEDAGIVETIRRGGPAAAQSEQLGCLTSPMLATEQAVASYTETFVQDVTRRLSRRLNDPASVGRPYAERIFRSLCDLRGARGVEIEQCLKRSFEPTFADDPRLLFAGAAFAATGTQSIHRAFARSILSRMAKNQAYVEWTHTSQRRELSYRIGTTVCLLAAVLAAICLALQLLR